MGVYDGIDRPLRGPSKREAESDLIVCRQCGRMMKSLLSHIPHKCYCFPYAQYAMYYKLIEVEKEKGMNAKAISYPVPPQPKQEHMYDVTLEGLSETEFRLLKLIAGLNRTIPQELHRTFPEYTYHEVGTFLGKLASAISEVRGKA